MYEEFFGLEDQPFRLSPDHRFFYRSSAHTRALAHLKFGLDQREGFILITGEVGAGKTTLVEHLLASLNSRQYVAANIVTTNLDQENLVRMIASSFGLVQEGLNKTSVLRTIEKFLADASRKGQRCLLFVDEAQNLSISALEELRMLSNLQVNGRPALQSFLLGQPQFRKTLARPDLAQLRQRVIASYHLGPLNEEETAAYILHRLEVAGWTGDPDFDGEALAAIFEFSGGIPRSINTLTNRLLLNAYLEETHLIAAKDVALVSSEIAHELGQVVDDGLGDVLLENAVKLPEAGVTEKIISPVGGGSPVDVVGEERRDVPIPHVADGHLAAPSDGAGVVHHLEPKKTIEPKSSNRSQEHSIPQYEEDNEADIIDLTIHAADAADELSLEAEMKLKKRALHTVIDFFGGRGGS
jgi:general secretion pathway protein A